MRMLKLDFKWNSQSTEWSKTSHGSQYVCIENLKWSLGEKIQMNEVIIQTQQYWIYSSEYPAPLKAKPS